MKEFNIVVGSRDLELRELVEFLAGVFGTSDSKSLAIKSSLLETEPSTSPANMIVARSAGGELVGAVRIVERDVVVGGARLSTGGISSMAVHPEWRGRGMGRALMREAVASMARRGKDISVLYGRRAVDGFYPRFGYRGVGRYADLELLDTRNEGSDLEARPAGEGDRDALARFYANTYADLTGSMVRDAGVWKFLFAGLATGRTSQKVFLCLRGSQPIGYAVVMGEGRLVELSVPPDLLPAVPAILGGLNVKSVSLHPRHPFFIYCRTHMNTVLHERFALDGGYMARLLNPGNVLAKLADVYGCAASKLRGAGDSFTMLGYNVDLAGGKVRETTKQDDIRFVDPDAAILLLLGVIPPEDVPGVRWPEDKDWLPRLFPFLGYHTSAWDEI